MVARQGGYMRTVMTVQITWAMWWARGQGSHKEQRGSLRGRGSGVSGRHHLSQWGGRGK